MFKTFDVTGSIIVTPETKDEAYRKIKERLDELDIKYETEEKQVQFTAINVTLKFSTIKAVKHLLKLVGAPEEELNYLAKVKSVVVATAKDLLNNLLSSIKDIK